MITIKITFLLSFKLGGDPNTENVKNETKKKGKKGKKGSVKSQKKKSKTSTTESKKGSKKSKSSSKTKIPKTEHKKEEEFVFNVSQPIGCLHVEYTFIPSRFIYWFDVICWGSIAKVYTTDGTNCWKTIIKDDKVWVPVFIEHYLNSFSEEEIYTLKNNLVSFNFSTDKNKLGTLAKSEKCKTFYIFEEDINLDDFAEAFTENPNTDETRENRNSEKELLKKHIKEILADCVNKPHNQEVVSWIHYRNKVHVFKVHDIISKISLNEEIECREVTSMEGATVEKKNKKKDKKKKKPKKTVGGSTNVGICGEILFTDATLTTHRAVTSNPQIAQVFILISSENLLTIRQKIELNPIVIKVLKINNLPSDVLVQNGFNALYVDCSVPNLIEFKTKVQPISETIKINESHFIITNNLSQLKFIEMLQTQKLVLEICGIREIPPPAKIESCLTQKKEKKSSKKKKTKKLEDEAKSEVMVVALAGYDLSSLLTNTWIFKEKSQCHNPNVLLSQRYYEQFNLANFVDKITVNEVNAICDTQRLNSSPLGEDILLLKGTTLKLEVYFFAPQCASLRVRRFTRKFKRLLLILFNPEIAQILLNEILLYNQEFRGPHIVVPNFVLKLANEMECLSDLDNVLTGFLIDSGDHFVFFVEGESNGFILELYHRVNDFNMSIAKVFYNSDYVFENRLYENMLLIGGFYCITLKMPLQDIFAIQETYIEGSMPPLCWRAVKKLHLLYHSTMFESILYYNLLPTHGELLSFSIEFGLQLRYKSKESLSQPSLEGGSLVGTKVPESLLASKTDLFGNTQVL